MSIIRSLARRSTTKLLAGGLTLVLLVGACTSAPPLLPTAGPSGLPTSTPTGAINQPTDQPTSPLPSSEPTIGPSPSPTAEPTPTPPQQAVEMPFVPVVSFWSTRLSMPLDELRAALATGGHGRVVVAADDVDAIGAALGVALASSVERSTPEEVRRAVREPGVLGMLRVTDVDQSVRALGIDGAYLFGNDRVARIADWPLRATVSSSVAWEQSASWTLVAAGDIMLDRGVAQQTTILGKGGDYLFDGGTAHVTRVRCCSFYNYEYPDVERTGNKGLVRELFTSADFSMANLETGILVNAPFHAAGFTFTGDATLLGALQRAGLDYLSNANNHSRNGGARGLSTAIEELDRLGIAHAGAGRGPAEAARPAIVEVNGTRLGIISCDAIAKGYVATTPDELGTMSCKDGSVARTLRQTRPDVDVLIVFPHWGVEYYPKPRSYQRDLAAEWIAAGADMIVGAHSHFPGGMEDIDGQLVFYSLGNLIFDQDFRQATMMGLVPEMTFNGGRLMQVWLHTTLIVDAQPNLADPDGDGQFAYDLVRQGSQGLLDY